MASAVNSEQKHDHIERRLSWTDRELKLHSISETELLERFAGPIVVLGDPGMGKTWTMERYGQEPGCRFIRATSLLRQPDDTDFGSDRLIIDGLDEVSALGEGDPLNSVLVKLLACAKPAFVLSCRAAEWRGRSAEIDIADEYGVQPHVVDLELLTQEEAVEALARRVDPQAARSAIHALQAAGLETFFQNPLYLDFVAAIVSNDDDVPQSRAALYDKAIGQLCVEKNPHHSARGFAALSKDAALDAAGALAAAMLVTGEAAIVRDGNPSEGISVSDVGELADVAEMRSVLGSNLFRSFQGSTGQFKPLHRTVAEFLAARWLSRFVDREMDTKNGPRYVAERLIGLICAEGGVPASLRGLHAWLPKFSPTRLGPGAIERDPYGVLRYGDGDGLAPSQAGALIAALRQQAIFDPHFREGWGRSEALGGLVQPALVDDIRSIITDTTEEMIFRLLIIEAIVGSEVASLLRDELNDILFDKQRVFRERRDAGEALAGMEGGRFDWPTALERLICTGDVDSTRIATELLDDIGYATLEPQLVARVILADCRLSESEKGKWQRTFGSFYRMEHRYPEEHIPALLDTFARELLPKLDPKKWWDDGLHDGWSEFGQLVVKLVARQLTIDPQSVSPIQLWSWLRLVERQHRQRDEDHEVIASIVKADDRLRRGVQRLALFEDNDDDRFFTASIRLARMSVGFHLTAEDADLFLREIVAKKNPADRERWKGLVAYFREDGIIPVPVRRIARPYAKGDPDLMEFLVARPKRQKLDDWELKFRRRDRERKRREEKNRRKQRQDYGDNIALVRAGELGWILRPAKAYLNMYSDLDRDAKPEARLEEWLGPDLRDAALRGFEAVLHRNDLPSADQIAQSYAESRVWNFVFPMLAGAGQRFTKGNGFADLSSDLVSALLIAMGHELVPRRETYEGLGDTLREILRRDEAVYEAHVRRMIEPMLAAKREHIHDLYRYTRLPSERPLSTRLSLEWLLRFPDLPLEVERYLVEGILHTPPHLRNEYAAGLVEIVRARLSSIEQGSDRDIYWRGIQFCIDFDEAIANLPSLTDGNRNWLWSLTQPLNDRNQSHEHYLAPSLKQLAWLFRTFRHLWPFRARPSGTTSGDRNPWDATQLLEWVIYQIGKIPSVEASEVLRELRDMPDDGYTPTIQANIASQRRAQVEAKFQTPTLAEYKAVLTSSGQPQSAADIQAIILAELDALQTRLRGDPLNPADNFYLDDKTPKGETACRDQMLLLLGDNLPFGIQAPAEVAMPRGKRSDGAFTFGNLVVPLECKGQWHKDVWTAAAAQLDRFYAIHHKAAQKGIYVVFWFGSDVPPRKRLKFPKKGTPPPVTAHEMRFSLQAALPSEKRGEVAIVVLDVGRSS